MYVFCVGMYRSCSTWQYEVACHLVETHRGGERLGFWKGEQFAAHAASGIDPARWRVLKSHDADEHLGSALRDERALGFYSYRDVRDVTYSLIHKFRSDFDDIVVGKRLMHATLDNDRFWTAQPNTLRQRYETLISDPVGGVEEIAAHLGVTLGAGEAGAIAANYSHESNLRRTTELARRLESQGIDLSDNQHALLHDSHSLLHWNHLRAGRVGGWREDATPAQRIALAEICGEWLVERGYERDASWSIPPEGLIERIAEQTRDVAELETRLAEARAELVEIQGRLGAFEEMGPLALKIARGVHRLAGPHRNPARTRAGADGR